ncbi:uncharacterized protein LDX57_002397 [Aspergillus melleus]|uniref:uncharacterized protein n=1 Tax=Aspergillus melleus TaxID=138277 RepID=UPI001E8CA88A|nr:uncharacterized protein LDX57_002397 [Aspergillus melleus]KAH8424653.1 hypothetical protein LDX57_002397 [Aspergillus melleus]
MTLPRCLSLPWLRSPKQRSSECIEAHDAKSSQILIEIHGICVGEKEGRVAHNVFWDLLSAFK